MKTRRVALQVSLATLLAVGLYAGFLAWDTERRWEHLQHHIERLFVDEGARPTPRCALRPFTLDGDAWPEYLSTVEIATRENWDHIEQFVGGDQVPDVVDDRLLQARARILNALTSGVRRKSLVYADREAWLRQGSPYRFMHLQKVMALAALDARERFLRGGDVAGALDRILDLLQFSRDWSEGGGWEALDIHRQGLTYALPEVERILSSDRWDVEAGAKLEAALRVLDEMPPDLEGMLRRRLAEEGARVLGRGPWLWPPGVRDLYSVRRKKIAYFRGYEMLAAGVRDDWSEPEESAHWDSLGLNPPEGPSRREARAYVRVLRGALEWRRTGRVPDLKDPYGGRLMHREEEGRLALWSVGEDLKDDGGNFFDMIKIHARR